RNGCIIRVHRRRRRVSEMGNPVARAAVGAAFALFVSISAARSVDADPVYLFDTGPGRTSSLRATALFGTGSPPSAPRRACRAPSSFGAAQFTRTQAATLDSIEAWVKGGPPSGNGGKVDVKIRTNVNGKPSTSSPPLYSPNSIVSKRYDVTNFASAG